jgi:hypothetical protein
VLPITLSKMLQQIAAVIIAAGAALVFGLIAWVEQHH